MSDDYQPEHRAEEVEEVEEPVIGDAPPRAHVLFSNSVYDKLKFVAMILLPALGAAYFGLAPLWELPKADEVVGTIVVIDTLLGALLAGSSRVYNNSDARFDGEVLVQRIEGTDEAAIGFAVNSSSVVGKDEIVLKVQK